MVTVAERGTRGSESEHGQWEGEWMHDVIWEGACGMNPRTAMGRFRR
jgi:hypothetical protein